LRETEKKANGTRAKNETIGGKTILKIQVSEVKNRPSRAIEKLNRRWKNSLENTKGVRGRVVGERTFRLGEEQASEKGLYGGEKSTGGGWLLVRGKKKAWVDSAKGAINTSPAGGWVGVPGELAFGKGRTRNGSRRGEVVTKKV